MQAVSSKQSTGSRAGKLPAVAGMSTRAVIPHCRFCEGDGIGLLRGTVRLNVSLDRELKSFECSAKTNLLTSCFSHGVSGSLSSSRDMSVMTAKT